MIPEFHDYLLEHHEMRGPPLTLFLAVDVFAARKVAYFFRRYRVEALFLSRLVLDYSIVKDSNVYLLKTENTKLAQT